MRRFSRVLSFLVGLLTLAMSANLSPALAQGPTPPLGTAFTYQGVLRTGASAASGVYDFRFRLYGPTGAGNTVQFGSTLCADNVTVQDGRFTVTLDFGAQFIGYQRLLEIEVRADTGLSCDNPAGFVVLAPRQTLNGTPNALFASNALLFDGLPSYYFRNAANLNNGTIADTLLSANVAQLSTAQTITGAKTFSTAPAFTATGAPFTTTSTVKVDNLNADLLDGLDSTAFLRSTGSQNLSGNSNGFLLFVDNAGESGRGIYGYGNVSGVYGGSFGLGGVGVYGVSAGTGANNSSGNKGVYGSSAYINGYGVYSSGNFGATGTKAFRIDHPEDPANKYLMHYCTESPEVLNTYRGTVTLNASGEASVQLPHYFARINKSPSYTLTAVGTPMPMLHIAEEIDEAALVAGAAAGPGESAPLCSFRIGGGVPGGKVSWRIEAVRNDKWMQQGGAPVESQKEGREKGTYQHPEFYGQPPEKGTDARVLTELRPGGK